MLFTFSPSTHVLAICLHVLYLCIPSSSFISASLLSAITNRHLLQASANQAVEDSNGAAGASPQVGPSLSSPVSFQLYTIVLV